jgi:hypothetical protein
MTPTSIARPAPFAAAHIVTRLRKNRATACQGSALLELNISDVYFGLNCRFCGCDRNEAQLLQNTSDFRSDPVGSAWQLSPGRHAPLAEGGGARRDRTADLLHAMQALSQLSYGPFRDQVSVVSNQKVRALRPARDF